MLKNQLWMRYSDDLLIEYYQCRDEGKDISGIKERIDSILAMDKSDERRELLAAELLDEMQQRKTVDGYKYNEPSELNEIKELRSSYGKELALNKNIDIDVYYDKVYGAWLARCAGCLLGQPVECWRLNDLISLLKDTNNYPINYYISSDIEKSIREKYGIDENGGVHGSPPRNWINRVNFMPEDDDTNYTIIGMKVLETYGPNFTSEDVAECWLNHLPFLHVCTAERAAYRNLTYMILPPKSASFRNPYREYIGAQIRADFFGYINPGDPERAADMAFRDAAISHVKNGIYGEMFIAAMLAAAAVEDDVQKVIEIGLSQIPENSRLTETIRSVLRWKEQNLGYLDALKNIYAVYDENNNYHWCHTISNAAIVCIALLYGDKDLEKSLGIAVSAAFDTDCNGVTVGSILGMMLGAKKLPEKWIAPLNDTIKSGVAGYNTAKISDLAKNTVEIYKRITNNL